MSKFTCLVVCVVAVSLSGVYAVTEEEKATFFEAFRPVVAECSQSHGVSEEDIKAAKEAATADGINPCFMGCVLKKTGVINEQGDYDANKGLSMLKKFLSSTEDYEKFEAIGKKCSSVNDQAVSDKEAGCERAQQVVNCLLENKAALPI